MKLYKIYLNGKKIVADEIEVVEKPKTYKTIEEWPVIVKKNNIGELNHNEMWLLEPDKQKYKDDLLKVYEKRIEIQKGVLEQLIQTFKNIKNLPLEEKAKDEQ